MKLILLILLFPFIVCCKKKFESNEKANDNEWVEIWRSPLQLDSSLTSSIKPILTGSNVIFTNVWNIGSDQFILLDGETGERLGLWRDYLYPRSALFDYDVKVSGERIYVTSEYTISCFNKKSMVTQWLFEFPAGNSTGVTDLTGNKLYSCLYFDGSRPHKRAAILSSGVTTADFDTVHQLRIDNGFAPFLYSFKECVTPSGERVLLYRNRGYDYSNLKNRFSIECYSLDRDSLLWVNDSLEDVSGILPMTIDGDRVICPGAASIWCLDIESGKLRWEYDHSNISDNPNYSFGGTILIDNKLIAKGKDQALIAIDATTGGLIWAQKSTGYIDYGTIIEFEGNIYFCGSGELWVVDATTGVVLFRDGSPTRYRGFNSSPTIDPVRRVIYLSDEVFAYCMELPELN